MSTPTTTTPLDGEDLINYDDVTARLAYLESHDCHRADWCADYECATCDDASGNELADLRDLEEAMRPANEASGRASAIRDSYLETYVREEADGITGIGETFLDSYVRWDDLAADRAAEMEEVAFRGTAYYITT